MSTPRTAPALTKRGKILLLLGSWLILSMIFVVGAEIIVQRKGFSAWSPAPQADIKVSPGGRFFVPDPLLGYRQKAGKFDVTLMGEYTFHATQLPNGLRITHPLETYDNQHKKDELWIFGCSFTHGWSLNDEQTYPWLLQERFPEYEVVNFGVEGYGTIHSLLQFREAIKERTPKVAVLAYLSFHDVRNIYARARQKAVAPWNHLGPLVQPYATLDREGKLHYAMGTVEYHEAPLMRYSALFHFLEQKYNDWEVTHYQAHKVSEALILQLDKEAREHGVKLLVAGLGWDDDETRSMLTFAQEHGIPSIDIAVDPKIKGNTSMPYDPHPGPLADRTFADKLEGVLRNDLLK